MSKNPIIVFEGIEGSGKTLHINSIARYLKKKKKEFCKTKRTWWDKNCRNNKKNYSK